MRACLLSPWRGRRAHITPGERADDHPDASARTVRILRHCRSSAAELAGRRARGLLDHCQLRSVGHRPPDGAPGAARADRRAAAARRAELELARIRHAGGCLALLRIVCATWHPADAR